MNFAQEVVPDWLNRLAQCLGDLIRLCDQHAGFVSAILTGVYVLATLGLVLLGYRQFRLALRLERSRIRPSVIIDMVTAHAHVHVTLKNLGQTPAYDVRVLANPEIRLLSGGENTFPSEERDQAIPFLRDGVAMMASGREYRSIVGFWPRVRSHYPTLRFSGAISYRDADGTSYNNEPFVIDLSAEVGVTHITRYDVHDLVENLKELQKDVHHFSTGFSKPLIRIIEDDEYERRENRWTEQAIADMERKGMFQDARRRSDKTGRRFIFRAAAAACLGVVLALSFTRKA